MKKINFLIKINSYGIYFMLILLVFIIYTGFSSIYNTTYDFNYLKNSDDPTQPRHLYLFGENPSLLAGSLTMGFFSHSFVLPIIKNNANQKNNKRDLFYGYCLVTLTYIIIGILGYIGFSGKKFSPNFYDVS